MDDLLLLKDGKRDLTGKGRYDEIEPDKDENLTKTREEINTNEAGKNEFKEKESVGYKKTNYWILWKWSFDL
nr:Hyp2 [Leptospira interrogans serovar Copenhageni/Icterohaemorrhagiae]